MDIGRTSVNYTHPSIVSCHIQINVHHVEHNAAQYRFQHMFQHNKRKDRILFEFYDELIFLPLS